MSNRSPVIKILVAPLDWGLGHTTRCIPIIRELRDRGCTVLFAGEGPAVQLICQEFPGIQVIPLRGYRIHYGNKGLVFSIFRQIPRIFWRIREEHRWLKSMVKKEGISAVISDNRWGLFHNSIPTIFITHQLHIITPYGEWLNRLLSQIHGNLIRKFGACWVPDIADEPGLAGKLSHPEKLPPGTSYLGCLSRLNPYPGMEKKYDLAAIISGPEPQRTLFEQLIINQLLTSGKTAILVSGLPDKSFDRMLNPLVHQVSHLPLEKLGIVLQESDLIICRSGYTTLMDLVRLGKKAVIIPTPGQTEQQYLAEHSMKQGWFLSKKQDQLDLEKLDQDMAGFTFKTPPPEFQIDYYPEIIRLFLKTLEPSQ